MIWVEIEARLVLAGVFAVSAASKLHSAAAFDGFVTAVRRLGGLRAPYLRPAAALLAGGEALIAAGLLVPATAYGAMLLAPVLLLAFTAALARALLRRDPVACNCFGRSERPVGAVQLARNALLVTLAACALAGWPAHASGPSDAGAGPLLVCALGAVVATGAVALWDDLAELLAPRRVRA
ncbi:hypothetical protein NMG29_33525 [Streptomyces cocklensis]|uniref:Methylamine utilization protein MauE n=1 Tax=Actinacidiphila cocklensis TaxID=887465 RepID=A0A9W4DQC3_9ACTN|nr:MauE/DoxX family redox-associated membrane protein [Actinacidiphila cocklensis]MDD1063053.1 hypothetical protein [Actinacidiphila cocklensis]CAG6394178.1 Methylamine utilization protein MauE [Actinacidiphila cocklensis]